MPADLGPIIEEIANRADEFLVDVHDRTEARAGIAELLTTDYPKLKTAERTLVVDGVMGVLEEEEFFETEVGGEPPADTNGLHEL